MFEPIVFISRFRVKAGKAEAYKELQRDTAKLLLADKPRTLVYLAYLTENSEQITIVHAFADSESMDLQFQGAFERAKVGFELFEPDGWEIYGKPSEEVSDAPSSDGSRRNADAPARVRGRVPARDPCLKVVTASRASPRPSRPRPARDRHRIATRQSTRRPPWRPALRSTAQSADAQSAPWREWRTSARLNPQTSRSLRTAEQATTWMHCSSLDTSFNCLAEPYPRVAQPPGRS